MRVGVGSGLGSVHQLSYDRRLHVAPRPPDHRPPATDHRPLTIGHRPPTTDHRLPATDDRSPTTDRNPPTTHSRQTIGYKDLLESGDEKVAKEKGLLRMEGKDYEVQDGDCILFRFNV